MYVISASYGNDSMALIQFAHEQELKDVTVVYCDTGWASKEWTKRIKQGEALAKKYGFKTVRIKSMGMSELIRSKKGFPFHGSQFCTGFLKGIPFLDWIEEVDTDNKAVVMIGKRREESAKRADTPEWVESSDYHGGRQVWHPLYLHSAKMRNDLLHRAGIEVLPHRSDECFPCVNANRNDLRRLPQYAIERLDKLEQEIGQPMFRASKHAGAQGIEEVVNWAKYSPGQYDPDQDDLFDMGCGSPFGCGL